MSLDEFSRKRSVYSGSGDFMAFAALPDEQKRELCIQLLDEFGVGRYNETHKGELQHQCSLPLGGHTDGNSMSASINYRKLTFKCYVCGNAGGLLYWIAVNRRETSAEARDWLEKTSGVERVLDLPMLLKVLEALAHPTDFLNQNAPIPTFGETTLKMWSKQAVGMFHPYLTLPISEGGREIPEQTCERFELGYCDEDEQWRYYQRIIIPLRWQGKLVGWQARRLWPDDPQPMKYKNSPDFPRDRTLYGDLEHRDIVLVESPMSVLRHSHHLPMVATLGANISPMQLPLLHRYRRITLWYDNDKAGTAAILGTRETPGLAKALGPYCEISVVQSPYSDADPADVTEADAARLVSEAVPFVLWKRPRYNELIPYQRSAA